MYPATGDTPSRSLVAILVDRAASQPDDAAYHFIGDDPASEIKLPFAGALTFVSANVRLDGVVAALEGWVQPEEIVRVLPSGATSPTAWITK